MKFGLAQSRLRDKLNSWLETEASPGALASFGGYTTVSLKFRAQGCFPLKPLILRDSLGGGMVQVPKHVDRPIPNHIHKYSGSSKSTKFIVPLLYRHFASLKPFEQSGRGILQKKIFINSCL
jgi:hypothetical protein